MTVGAVEWTFGDGGGTARVLPSQNPYPIETAMINNTWNPVRSILSECLMNSVMVLLLVNHFVVRQHVAGTVVLVVDTSKSDDPA
jgi:hypothetical protein